MNHAPFAMKSLYTFTLILLNTAAVRAAENGDWFPFEPGDDAAGNQSPISLRALNEAFAGEHGVIAAGNGAFIHSGNGKPVRFWAVNGPPEDLTGEKLQRCARLLAGYGVNLVRVHGALFDKDGKTDLAKVRH